MIYFSVDEKSKNLKSHFEKCVVVHMSLHYCVNNYGSLLCDLEVASGN